MSGHLTTNCQSSRLSTLALSSRSKGGVPKFTDEIESISIKHEDEGIIKIDGSDDEVQALSTLADEIANIDPDFVFTQDGDAFLFPYLAHRANVNECSNVLVLGREPHMQIRKPSKDGTTYFSYGKIHYRPSSTQLFGRVHIDTHNSFILDEAGMQGLFEVARICRMPTSQGFSGFYWALHEQPPVLPCYNQGHTNSLEA